MTAAASGSDRTAAHDAEPSEKRAEPPEHCDRCPRLVAFRAEWKRREPDWRCGAVPSFGDANARLLILGLAPGLRGANRTGRPFTGDQSGALLFKTLAAHGFTDGAYEGEAGDGVRLRDAMVTNAVRCAPPQNKPTAAEINACRPFLLGRIDALPKLRAILCLGKIAHDSAARALGGRLKDHIFKHGARHEFRSNGRDLALFDSYHCSRYNIQTGVLTPAMFDSVIAAIKDALDA